MNSIFFLILRRMRAPLITLIVSYAIAITGMTLVPGVDNQGQPWTMSLFEAFYVISYTATTIGFGEVPFPYSSAQRLWMSFSIYLTVIPWFYAIGKLIALAQDPGLRQAIITSRFARAVKRLHEPFYLICGYGETAHLLVRALDTKGIRLVVVELQQDKLNELQLEDYNFDIPSLCADAQLPDNLIMAGVLHPLCRGVVALTDNDHANLAVSIAAKLLNPPLMVLARAEDDEIAANMAAFGTNHILNPYTLFGDRLAIEVHAIGTWLLHEWLTDVPGDTLISPPVPPIGKWVICGYGRFGKSVEHNLTREDISTVIVEADPALTGCDHCIVGSGTEVQTLKEAGINEAVALVAGTNNDINNLAIVMNARQINPNLFVVIRKNKRLNQALFEKFNADITMDPSDIIAHECLAHMVSPLLAQFLTLSRQQTNAWANQLISHLVERMGEAVPETWAATIDPRHAPAVINLFGNGMLVSIDALLHDPYKREENLPAVPLLLARGDECRLLPDLSTPLMDGDRVLFCGRHSAKAAMQLILNDHKTLAFIITGEEISDSIIWRWLSKHFTKRFKKTGAA